MEDTYNLLGHALRKVLDVIACQQGRELAVVASEAGADILNGSSLKASLDIDWDNPEQRQLALEQVLQALEAVESWLGQLQPHDIPQTVNPTLRVARQIVLFVPCGSVVPPIGEVVVSRFIQMNLYFKNYACAN